jgi:hypothetical protein
MSRRLGSKPMRELYRRFKSGYSIKQVGSSHFRVYDPEGNVVRDGLGRPISLPNSPTADHHFVRRVVSDLRKAKVIE